MMQSMSTILASMLSKQNYPQQCSQQTDKWQQETDNYFWQCELSINREIDKVEAILDSSLVEFNQLVKKEAIPLMY